MTDFLQESVKNSYFLAKKTKFSGEKGIFVLHDHEMQYRLL